MIQSFNGGCCPYSLQEPSPLLRQQEENVEESEDDRATVTTVDKDDTMETESKKTDDDVESSSVASTPVRAKTVRKKIAERNKITYYWVMSHLQFPGKVIFVVISLFCVEKNNI